MLKTIPLTITATGSGESAEEVLVGVLKADLDGLLTDIAALRDLTLAQGVRLADLREALRWYADAHNYQPSACDQRGNWYEPIECDAGTCARNALRDIAQWENETPVPRLVKETA